MQRVRRFALFALLGGAVCCASPAAEAPVTAPTAATSAPVATSEGGALQPGQRAIELQRIHVLSLDAQLAKWRAWAASDDTQMAAEALLQLALLGDDAALSASIGALERGAHGLYAPAARVLAYLGAPRAAAAKAALSKALASASEAERAEMVWALLVLDDPAASAAAIELFGKGAFDRLERLEGGPAFDAQLLAGALTSDQLAGMATATDTRQRRLAALGFANRMEARRLDVLVELVGDADPEVAAAAAGGLARMPDQRAREAVGRLLAGAAQDQRARYLEAIARIAGGNGLVLALDSVAPLPESTSWFQTAQIFRLLRELADPRAGDALVQWAESKGRHAHWIGQVGVLLAEVGDLRASKYLARTLGQEPAKLYAIEKFWQAGPGGHLSKTDGGRVEAVRLLAELALLHPEQRAQLMVAEKPLLKWLSSRPEPHDSGMRLLARIDSGEGRKLLRGWAFTREPLPGPGSAPPFPAAWMIAQSALRYVGAMRDPSDHDRLIEYLDLKTDKGLDITQDGLLNGGHSMLGMALRAAGTGAARGLSEWGDRRAAAPLIRLIEDETWHEDARLAACESLAWCASPGDLTRIAARASELGSATSSKQLFIAACYAVTLSRRPLALDAVGIATSFDQMKDARTRDAAALTLLLGAGEHDAARAVATYGDLPEAALIKLKDSYFRSFGFWGEEDLLGGHLYRWAENARAIARVSIRGDRQRWALERLAAQLQNVAGDDGPHSLTRTALRHRLIADAAGNDARKAGAAMLVLALMKEQGPLLALADGKGERAELARSMLHALRNPAPAGDDLRSLQQEQTGRRL